MHKYKIVKGPIILCAPCLLNGGVTGTHIILESEYRMIIRFDSAVIKLNVFLELHWFGPRKLFKHIIYIDFKIYMFIKIYVYSLCYEVQLLLSII